MKFFQYTCIILLAQCVCLSARACMVPKPTDNTALLVIGKSVPPAIVKLITKYDYSSDAPEKEELTDFFSDDCIYLLKPGYYHKDRYTRMGFIKTFVDGDKWPTPFLEAYVLADDPTVIIDAKSTALKMVYVKYGFLSTKYSIQDFTAAASSSPRFPKLVAMITAAVNSGHPPGSIPDIDNVVDQVARDTKLVFRQKG